MLYQIYKSMHLKAVFLLVLSVLFHYEEAGPPRRSRRQILQAPHEGDVRLERYDSHQQKGTGNVLVYHDRKWGVVCDDGWNLNSANVVCKSLGFPQAVGYTVMSHFGIPRNTDIILDNVECTGREKQLVKCKKSQWYVDDCDLTEAAGVYCAPKHIIVRRPATSRQTPRQTTLAPDSSGTAFLTPVGAIAANGGSRGGNFSSYFRYFYGVTQPTPTQTPSPVPPMDGFQNDATLAPPINDVLVENIKLEREVDDMVKKTPRRHQPDFYEVRLVGGRDPDEGRVEIKMSGKWGTICSDTWTLKEATVLCRHLGKGHARSAIKANFFGGDQLDKMANDITCDGLEENLYQCYHGQIMEHVTCSKPDNIAGVICTNALPDLVPNATLVQTSAYIQDRPMYYLQCAMEEGCASSSAYVIRTRRDWHIYSRRLFRFSSSTWNFGNADFRPFLNRQDWEWHSCHMHYHSMSVFAHYDLLDLHGNRVAEGHKASFCLEDVQCMQGVEKKFECKGFREQGISVGCADDYLHDIDCQWIDITDIKPGQYTLRIHINPDMLVAELNYDNNVVSCDVNYYSMGIRVTNCRLVPGF